MACLPETGEEERETPERTEPPRSFGEGFVTGILAALVCVIVLTAGGRIADWLVRGRSREQVPGAEVLTDGQTLDKLKEVQELIQSCYLEDVDSDMLSAYLFKGVAAGLDDVYARYYTEEEFNSVQESNHGAYYGIGVTLSESVSTGELSVLEVYKGSPADEAGMKEGDILRAVAGTSLEGMELSDTVSLIKENEDEFEMTVYRPSEEREVTLKLACGTVEKNTVEAKMKEPGIGYIRIVEFDTITVDQFKTAVDELTGQGAESLVIDLRDNPGGLLDSVCDIVDYILPEGLIVYTEDRDGNREEFRSDDKHSVDCELAVLVNENSASASEIFAGAIQDREAGTVVGTTTYGKGVVQKTYILSDGSAMKFTVEKYFTPNGTDINGEGITPDIMVGESKDDGGQLTADLESGEIQEGSGQEESKEMQDAPLEKALEVLREHGTENHIQGETD